MIELLRMFTEAYRGSSPGEKPQAAGPSPAGSPPSPFDFLRLQAMIYEESRRIHGVLFDRLIAPARSAAGAAAGEDDLAGLLRRAQLLLLEHPVAAQAAFAALIAEGRRFAATPEGAEWEAALAGSELVRRGRRVWDAVAMNMLEDDPGTVVPSVYLEALLRAARSLDLDSVLDRLQAAPEERAVAQPPARSAQAPEGGDREPAR